MYFILVFDSYQWLLRSFLSHMIYVDLSTFILSCGLLFSLSQCSLGFSANMWSVCSMGHNLSLICCLKEISFVDYLKLYCLSGWSFT